MIADRTDSDSSSSPVLGAESFDALLVAVQPRLRGYVASLLGGWAAVDDVVQETCVVLLQKRETFEAGTNFSAWAFRVAYFTAASWRRDKLREGRVMFSETFFQTAAAIAEGYATDAPDLHDALGHCMRQLPARDQELVRAKYVDGVSLVTQAAAASRGSNAVHKAISRIRLALRHCIHQRIHGDSNES